MAHKASPSAPNPKIPPFRTTKGAPASSVSSDSKPPKALRRKPSSKGTPLLERRIVRVSKMQPQLGQLQEELKKVEEEKSRALGELTEMKKGIRCEENDDSLQSRIGVRMLELELENAKESERKMLESLISQTKQLEQTKISLEEAKLEIRSLQDSIKSLEGSASPSSRSLEKHLEKNGPMDAILIEEDIRVLRNELKLSMEAEEKSRKAMDDLALALKEVTTEANQAKGMLSSAQSELENVRAEVERLEALLKITEEKSLDAVEESERVKLEMEESVSAWTERESGFIICMKASEDKIRKAIEENDRLRESREDCSKLRDLLKQAVNEATTVKESLEIARGENSQLKDLASEKENALQRIKQEYECLMVTEASALDSVRELKILLAATSTIQPSKTADLSETGSFRQMKARVNGVRGSRSMENLPSVHRKGENSQIQNGHWNSIAMAEKFKWCISDTEGTLERKDRMFASVSNITDSRVPSPLFMEASASSVTDSRVPSPLFMDYDESMIFDNFYHVDCDQLGGVEHEGRSPTTQKKKKPMLQRFGDMLKRRSFK